MGLHLERDVLGVESIAGLQAIREHAGLTVAATNSLGYGNVAGHGFCAKQLFHSCAFRCQCSVPGRLICVRLPNGVDNVMLTVQTPGGKSSLLLNFLPIL